MLNRYGAFHDIKIEKQIRSEKQKNDRMSDIEVRWLLLIIFFNINHKVSWYNILSFLEKILFYKSAKVEVEILDSIRLSWFYNIIYSKSNKNCREMGFAWFHPIIQRGEFLLYEVFWKNNVCFDINVGCPCLFERNWQVRNNFLF
jgi:hypothetical protein